VHQYLGLISSRCPSWATVSQAGAELHIEAEVVGDSGRPMPSVALRAWVQVQLRVAQRGFRRWPEGCPERHIEAPGTFCLGKGKPLQPSTNEQADTWWEWLRLFVGAQFFADRNQFWPTRFLHHGDASDVQIEMEDLARGTIFENDVNQAHDDRTGWLAEKLPRLTKDATHLVNLRAPCPRGCVRRKAPLPKGAHRKSYPVLRRACKQRQLVFSLVKLEYKRRKKEDEFWGHHPREICCGTMRDCPLR
jgi:hypothetical protein